MRIILIICVFSSINGKNIQSGEVIAYFDRIQLANFQEVTKAVSAHGGFDDRNLIIWRTTKQVDFSFIQGIFNHHQFRVMLNAGMVRNKRENNIAIHQRDYKTTDDLISDEFIYLTKEPNGDKLYIYEQTTYKYDGEGEPEGLIGQWSCAEKKWKFEFTDDGTFMEDGYFPGYYIVDEAEGSFKLIYNDRFEDTVCYYNITGDELLLEYPWCMVKAK